MRSEEQCTGDPDVSRLISKFTSRNNCERPTGKPFGMRKRNVSSHDSLTNVKPINVSKPFGMRKEMQALVTQKTRGIIAEDLKSKYIVSKFWQASRHACCNCNTLCEHEKISIHVSWLHAEDYGLWQSNIITTNLSRHDSKLCLRYHAILSSKVVLW